MIKTLIKIDNPNKVELTMEITMSLELWKEFSERINEGYPGWKVKDRINNLVEFAEKHFAGTVQIDTR